MRDRRWNTHLLTTAALVVAIVAIFAASLWLGRPHDGQEGFAGTDAVVTETLSESGVEPWFKPLFSPGSSEIESGLFALQAGIGGTILGFAIGALWGRRHRGAQGGGETPDSGTDAAPASDAEASAEGIPSRSADASA